MSKKISKIILSCALVLIIPIAIVATYLACTAKVYHDVTVEIVGEGEVEGINKDGYLIGDTCKITAIPKIGNEFISCQIKGSDRIFQSDAIEFEVGGPTTLVFTFKPLKYTLNFSTGFEGLTETNKEFGFNETLPNYGIHKDADGATYRFDGWFDNLGVKREMANFNESGEYSLTGRWSKQYFITLNYGERYEGATAGVPSVDTKFVVYNGESMKLPALPGKDKNVDYLKGWFNGETEVASDAVFTFDTATSTGNYSSLDAKWGAKVTFKFQNTDGSDYGTAYLKKGEVISGVINPSQNGYKFVEWQKDGAKYDISVAVTEAEGAKVTLKAKMEIVTYTITYHNVMGLDMSSYSTTYTVANNKSFNELNNSANGYIFAGWKRGSATGTPIKVTDGLYENLNIYATWTLKPYNINYLVYGNVANDVIFVGTKIDTFTVESETFNLPTILPLETGELKEKIFLGWFEKDGSLTGRPGEWGNQITQVAKGNKADINLYAKWAEIDVTTTDKYQGHDIYVMGQEDEAIDYALDIPNINSLDLTIWDLVDVNGVYFEHDTGYMVENGSADQEIVFTGVKITLKDKNGNIIKIGEKDYAELNDTLFKTTKIGKYVGSNENVTQILIEPIFFEL